MDELALFTRLWEHETQTTRNVIARIPENNDYRPDPKSRTAKQIAWQIVCEERVIVGALETGKLEWNPPPEPATVAALLEIYDRERLQTVARWKAMSAERWNATFEFFGHPRQASGMAWGFLFDLVHHRGQLSTYLRPMGSTVPQIYGPSADEP